MHASAERPDLRSPARSTQGHYIVGQTIVHWNVPNHLWRGGWCVEIDEERISAVTRGIYISTHRVIAGSRHLN